MNALQPRSNTDWAFGLRVERMIEHVLGRGVILEDFPMFQIEQLWQLRSQPALLEKHLDEMIEL